MDDITLQRALEIVSEKEKGDAPIAAYQQMPVTKGKGRFGPFIKWNNLYINVPKAYDFDNLTQANVEELIEKKVEKEANRFIQQWPDEKISLENGRWGAFIRHGKNMIKLGKKADGTKHTPEELTTISLEEVKAMIVAEFPNAFVKKATKKPAAKKAAAKKTVTKKAIKK